ncbi:MAG: hypothetical protein COV76_04490 [Candidatus Omnitrophica bacterium CG11_big_fil_rev_8_21_14_0_20_64_10]|nr:MAG: hypothetical protein COV76_04490 [Candidatus Omnitrophica bacterium CG11_big_fil_rev_8_21_14_0_20_64_10]
MKILRRYSLLPLMVFGALAWAGAPALSPEAWAEATGPVRFVPIEGKVTVTGTSTLHDWEAESAALTGTLTLPAASWALLQSPAAGGSRSLPAGAAFHLSTASLKSEKTGMDKRMHAALQAETHPTISYRLTSARIGRAGPDNGFSIETAGILTVAGVERPLEGPMRVQLLPDGRLTVDGAAPLKMSDFGIDPPRAMFGTIRSGDAIELSWRWTLQPAGDPA